MSSPLVSILQGSFISTGLATQLPLISGVQKFEILDVTNFGSAVAGTYVGASWQFGMPANSAFRKVVSAAPPIVDELMITAQGISFFETQENLLEAPFTITGITNAAPPVATTSAPHGYSTGDVIRLTNTTGALNLSNIEYVITVTGAATFQLRNQLAPGAAATAGFCRRLVFQPFFYPRLRVITNVVRGVTTSVTTSVEHGYQVGELVRFNVPVPNGITQLNDVRARVLSITNVNTFVAAVDSSSFSAYVFPAPTLVPYTQAQVIPFGDDSSTFAGAVVNTATRGLILGTNVVGTAGDVLQWIAYRGTSI